MAQPGARPKPAAQRILSGTHRATRHGDKAEALGQSEASRNAFGPLVRPDDMQDAARHAWSRYIEPCAWLDASKEPLAIAFCRLWQEFTEDPNAFTAARHGQLRLYAQELGLSDERARMAADSRREETEEERKWRRFDT